MANPRAGRAANSSRSYHWDFLTSDWDSDSSGLSSPPASPPPCLPTPPPSQDAGESRAEHCQDDLAPARKRRRVGPKERTTQHLDLSQYAPISRSEQQSQIDLLTKTIHQHRKIVVVAGAGISTSAGIPDFRSTDGLFKGLQKKHNLKASGKLLFDAAVYQDEALTATFHDMVRSLSEESEAAKTSPTEFHHMLARIGQEKRLTRLYTQNIDGIETSLQPLETNIPLDHKNPPPTVQLHGSLDKMVCQKCRCVENLDRQLFENPEAPECHACAEVNANRQAAGYRSHGIGRLRPRIVLYNEHNPDEEAITSIMNADIRSRPDALIVVGTSLKIPGVRHLVKNLCSVIRGRKNGVTMWINNEPPGGKEFEDCWDLVVKGSCDEVAGLANLKRWDDDSKEEVHPCSASEVEDARRRTPSVVVPASKKKQSTLTGLCTPSSSNDEDSLPHKPASNSTRPNPASRGRSVADVLGGKAKDPEKASRKSAPKKAPKQPRKKEQKKEPKNSNIKTFNTVTKSASTAPAKGKGEPDKSTLGSIPSNAARNNAPMFPNLRPRKDVTPVLESIPNGMDNLLN